MSFHKVYFVLRSSVINFTFYDLLYPELILYFIISLLTYDVTVSQTSGQPCVQVILQVHSSMATNAICRILWL